MDVSFLSKLEPKHILAAQEASHELWGNSRILEKRLQELKALLEFENGRFLFQSGVVDNSDRLIASCKCYSLLTLIDGLAQETLGIGAVFTTPEFRKQGYAAEVLRLVLEEAKQRGVRAAFLFSDIRPSYYEKLGFLKLPALRYSIRATDIAEAPNLEMRKATPEDTKNLVEWYETSWSKEMVRFCRRNSYWEFYRLKNLHATDFVLAHEGNEVGYASLTQSSEKTWVEEFTLPKDLEKNLLSTLKKKAPLISGWYHKELWHDYPLTLESREKGIPMICSLHPELDFSKIEPERFAFLSLDHF